ncbi:Holliday junction resolvase RuvX [Candidatus Sumerlaeota bacterium]|nr:Holliday junction resolvase RuvX [Candidatus Sumerlaeota bacterium]
MTPKRNPLPREGTLLALDPGERRVGVAVCDATQAVARPLATLERRPLRRLLRDLDGLLDEHQVTGLVIGLPLLESGERGKQAQRAQSLAFQLRERWPDLPQELWDERWSSAEADEALEQASRPEREAGRDAAAAAVILQSYLDARATE